MAATLEAVGAKTMSAFAQMIDVIAGAKLVKSDATLNASPWAGQMAPERASTTCANASVRTATRSHREHSTVSETTAETRGRDSMNANLAGTMGRG